jgi:hypothetical protein
MTKWVGFGLVVGVVLVGGYASADQCTNASATKSQWEWAKRHVRSAPSVLSFCQPCNDKAPRLWSGHHLDTEDLAYLYVQVGDDSFANLASMVGCPTTGVAPFIDRGGRAR